MQYVLPSGGMVLAKVLIKLLFEMGRGVIFSVEAGRSGEGAGRLEEGSELGLR